MRLVVAFTLACSTQAWAQTAAPVQTATFAQALPLCTTCHGTDGHAAVANTPNLAAQPRTFLENQLIMMREGLRPVPAMQGMLNQVSDETIIALAKHFAGLPARAFVPTAQPETFERGKKLSADMLCGTCHLPSQAGRDQIPRLAGQREDYLIATMKAFRDNNAPGRDTQMQNVMRGVSDAQISDLAHYFAALK